MREGEKSEAATAAKKSHEQSWWSQQIKKRRNKNWISIHSQKKKENVGENEKNGKEMRFIANIQFDVRRSVLCDLNWFFKVERNKKIF